MVKDDRVEVVAMPFRDGVSIIQRRQGSVSVCSVPTLVELLLLSCGMPSA